MKRNILLFVLMALLSVWTVEAQQPLREVTVILIVDSFTANPYGYEDVEGNCALNPNGQRWVSVSGARWVSVSGARWVSVSGAAANYANVPHGEIVYEEVIEEIRSNYTHLARDYHLGGTKHLLRYDEYVVGTDLQFDPLVVVAAIDTQDYDMIAISEGIRNAVTYFNELYHPDANYGVVSYVINMSFSIIPCEGLPLDYDSDPEAYIAEIAGLEGFEDLVGNLFIDNVVVYPTVADLMLAVGENSELFGVYLRFLEAEHIITLRALSEFYPLEAISFSLEDNSLQSTLQELIASDNRVIAIAASGNYGADYAYPFAPASWPQVLAVSAPDVDMGLDMNGNPVVFNANPGDVMVDSAFRDLLGSSFSAPRISVDAAMYLLNGNSTTCEGTVGVTSPPLVHGLFDDLLQAEAAVAYCDPFPQS